MTVVTIFGGVLLFLSAIAVVIRVERGPSMLDRMVGLDLLTSIVLGTVVLITAGTRRTDLLPVLIVLSIVGFIASTTVARFAAHEPAESRRILSKDEVAKILQEAALEEDDEKEPVHDPDRADEGDDDDGR